MARMLTEPQRRHLVALASLGMDGTWRPRNHGEQRCADALNARGLVRREYVSGMGPVYVVTDEGRQYIVQHELDQ